LEKLLHISSAAALLCRKYNDVVQSVVKASEKLAVKEATACRDKKCTTNKNKSKLSVQTLHTEN
jgi:hypothetical protein